MPIRLAIVLLLTHLFIVSFDAQAFWQQMSAKELYEQSELIVIAELIGHTNIKLSPDNTPLRLGILRVEDTLKSESHHAFLLLVLPSPLEPRVSTDIFHQMGQRGLWYLRVHDSGLYMADHPQRFVEFQ